MALRKPGPDGSAAQAGRTPNRPHAWDGPPLSDDESAAWSNAHQRLMERTNTRPEQLPVQPMVSYLILRPSEPLDITTCAAKIRSGEVVFRPTCFGIGFNHGDMFWNRHLLASSQRYWSADRPIPLATDVAVLQEFGSPRRTVHFVHLPNRIGVGYEHLLIDWTARTDDELRQGF